MTPIRIGVPCQCQNGHKAIWWYRLEDLRWVDEGVKDAEKCSCPKAEFGQGYRRDEGRVESTIYDRENHMLRDVMARSDKEALNRLGMDAEEIHPALCELTYLVDQFERLAEGLNLEMTASEMVDYLIERYRQSPA